MDKTKNKYISQEEFLNIANIKEKTLKKKYKTIPGITLVDGRFLILRGTRYPYNLGNNKLSNDGDKRYVLLKATYQRKYIGSDMLRVHQEEFEGFIKDFIRIGFLVPNDVLDNLYGANGYKVSLEGEKHLQEKRKETITFVSTLISECSGKFIGEILSKIYIKQ